MQRDLCRIGLSDRQRRLVFEVLTYWSPDRGWPWVGEETVAWGLGWDNRETRRVMGSLVKAGFLDRSTPFRWGRIWDFTGLMSALSRLGEQGRTGYDWSISTAELEGRVAGGDREAAELLAARRDLFTKLAEQVADRCRDVPGVEVPEQTVLVHAGHRVRRDDLPLVRLEAIRIREGRERAR